MSFKNTSNRFLLATNLTSFVATVLLVSVAWLSSSHKEANTFLLGSLADDIVTTLRSPTTRILQDGNCCLCFPGILNICTWPDEFRFCGEALEYNGCAGTDVEGTIPTELGLATQLTSLIFIYSNENLVGTIPTELGMLTKLTKLVLNHITLSGTIPSELGRLTALLDLDIYQPTIAHGANPLRGSIPTEIGLLTQLTRLILSEYELTGNIPAQLSYCTDLTYMSLRRNRLTGSIPTELGLLTRLNTFHLQENQLFGTVPLELGLIATPSLTQFDISANALKGSIPLSLCTTGINIFIDCLEVDCACGDRCKAPSFGTCPP